jgi:hypothetical protein
MSGRTQLATKDIAVGCGVPIVATAVLTRLTYDYLAPTLPELRLGMAVASAFCFSLSLTGILGMVMGYGWTDRSRRGRTANAGPQTPDDGAPMQATGRVRPLSGALSAPFSGTPCVSYQYRAYYLNRRTISGDTTAGGNADLVSVYWGYASRPFALDGPSRRVSVLAVPQLEVPVTERPGADAAMRAREFFRGCRFETTGSSPIGKLGAAFDQLKETLTDADGVVRRDWKQTGAEVDPAQLVLEERILPIDAEASVRGPWSSSKGAIVAPGGLLAHTHVVAVLGKLEPGSTPGLDVEQTTTSSITSIVAASAFGAGLIWLANSLPGWM